MKKLLLTAAALALAFPIAANAGSVTGTVGATAGATAGSDGASASMDTAGALSALSDSQGGIDAVGKVDANTKIQIVSVSDAEVSADAMSSHDEDIRKLREAIAAQADLKAKLEAQSIDPNNVVAVDTAADGTLVVYTKS